MEGRRDRRCRLRCRCRDSFGVAPIGARLEDCLRQLLDEQRHAVRACDDLVDDGPRERPLTGHVPHQGGSVPPIQTFERHNGDMRVFGPGRLELWAEGDEQQDREADDSVDGEMQKLQGTRVDPVRVLEHHQQRRLPGEAFELPKDGRERAFPLRRRAEWHGREAVGGQRQQLRQQPPVFRRCTVEKRLQLLGLRLGRVAVLETGHPLELAGDGEERAVAVVRRAEVAELGVGLAEKPLPEGGDEARLAHAGLGREQHHLAIAASGSPPAAPQQLDFLVAADERRQGRRVTQRLERLSVALSPRTRHARTGSG